MERIIETIKHGGAVFEIVERPETIYAGKACYTKGNTAKAGEPHLRADDEVVQDALDSVINPLPSAGAIHITIDFWKDNPKQPGFVFAKETLTKEQPEGVDVFVMPASLFIRGYSDAETARLLKKETCQLWELFAFIRNEIMPGHGYKMAKNGAQEMEYFDNADRTRGYAYIPVARSQGVKK